MDSSLSKYFNTEQPSAFDKISGSGSAGPPEQHGPPATEEMNSDIKSTVADEFRDLWPKPNFNSVATLMTAPGVCSANDLSDPIYDSALTFLGDSEAKQRHFLTAADVTQDERGLRKLISEGCYRSAVNLSSRLLTMYGQGYGRSGQPAKHTPHSLQLWFTRFALLVKLGLFELCQSEAHTFNDLMSPDVFFDFYPEMYNGRKGSMASFSFRLLLAELPMHMGNAKLSQEKLTTIYEVCSQIVEHYKAQEDVKNFWDKRRMRVIHSLVNCAMAMKNYNLADKLMENLAGMELAKSQLKDIYSTWGRIYLQFGDIFGAEQKMAESRRFKSANQANEARDLVDKGLVSIAKKNFDEALLFFNNALNINPENVMIYNNTAVTQLYSGELKKAIATYERAIERIPQSAINEQLLVNLSTLYELESSNSKAKKLNLLQKVNRQQMDLGLNIDYCLKLHSTL